MTGTIREKVLPFTNALIGSTVYLTFVALLLI